MFVDYLKFLGTFSIKTRLHNPLSIGHTLVLCAISRWIFSIEVMKWNELDTKNSLESFSLSQFFSIENCLQRYKIFPWNCIQAHSYNHPPDFNVKTLPFSAITWRYVSLSSRGIMWMKKCYFSNLSPSSHWETMEQAICCRSVVMSWLLLHNFNENQLEFKCQCRWHVIMSCFIEKHCYIR